MLSQWERYAFVYDLRLRPYPETAPEINLQNVVSLLEPRQQRGESVKLLNKETAAIRIQALRIDMKNAVLQVLINYADTAAVDPVFGNLQTGALRLEPKLDGEGIAVSAHMLVSLAPDANGAYVVVLEDVPGVGRTKITAFLTSEFRQVSDFPFRDVDGRVKKSRPMPELLGHQSQQLREGLAEGVLKGVELVRTAYAPGEFDEEGVTEEQKRTIALKVRGNLVGDAAVAVLNQIRSRALEHGYTNMRVRFRGPNRVRTVDVPTAREDAGDVLYVRYEHLGPFERPMQQSTDRLRDDMIEELMTLLESVRTA
jgi:hypothetical protein